ncbi:MAG: phosphatidate cytidylyltransferase [Firmicutes bacterium]|nr:phosphatidate cytidylyltransferase [Bacillota bacterium]
MLVAAWYGGIPLAVVVLIISVIGADELTHLLLARGIEVSRALVYTGAVACVGLAYLGDPWYWASFPALAAVACLGIPVVTHRRPGLVEGAASFLCVMYASYLLGHVMLIRLLGGGERLLVLVMVVTWATDTAAYFGGIRFGRRLMCPELSPKKTWEGAAAGALVGVAVSASLGGWAGFNLAVAVALGVVGTAAAQVGDLAESAIKRYAGVKDSGRIIPGHGGVLDRFDSLLFAAPVMFWVFRLVGR